MANINPKLYPFVIDYTETPAGGKVKADGQFFPETISDLRDEDLSKYLATSIGSQSTGVIPPVVRYMSTTKKVILLERPPTPVTVRFHGFKKSKVEAAQKQEFDIHLPWMCYCIVLDQHNWPQDVYMYVLKGPIVNGDTQLFEVPLPNIYEDDRFCLPNPNEYSNFQDISMADGINTAYELVWASNFNLDLAYKVVNAHRNGMPKPLFEQIGKYRSRVSAANLLRAWELSDEETCIEMDYVPASIGTVNALVADKTQVDAQIASGPFMMSAMTDMIREHSATQ